VGNAEAAIRLSQVDEPGGRFRGVDMLPCLRSAVQNEMSCGCEDVGEVWWSKGGGLRERGESRVGQRDAMNS